MSRNNLAYSKMVEEEHLQETEEKVVITKTSRPKGSAPRIILGVVAIGALLGCLIYGKLQTSNLYAQISEETSSINLLSSENVRMQTELESKISVKNVEDYAENTLGLEKLDKSQLEYVKVQNENVVEIPKTEDNFFVIIKHNFDKLVEYLRG